MARLLLPMGLAATLLAACQPVPVDPERAARDCEQRAQRAGGPSGNVTIGANSDDGPFLGAEIGLSSDFLAGRDPVAVYEECVYQRTGAAPIRPPRL